MTGRIFALIAMAALAIAGCSGDNGAPGAPGGVIGSVGTLPTDHPGNPDIDVDGVINNEGTGTWTIPASFVTLNIDGTTVVGNTLVYDSDANQWSIVINGGTVVLDDLVDFISGASAFNNFEAGDCADDNVPACTELSFVANTKYSVLVVGDRIDGTTIDADFYGHFGMATPAGDMPTTGGATYTGTSEYSVQVDTGAAIELTGSPTIVVDFTTAGLTVDYDDTIGGGSNELTINASATISGNSYTGSDFTGTFFDPDGTPGNADDVILVSGATLSGTFYGPVDANGEPDETAGVLSASDADATDADLGGGGTGNSSIGSVTGGFVADQ